MKRIKFSSGLVLLFSIALFAGACSMVNADSSVSHNSASDGSNTVGGPAGIHFKIDGKQYDISIVRGIYKKGVVFSIYNAALPGFPDTTITLSVGANFTGGIGTFKSDVNDKGFVFGFNVGNMKDMISYIGGKDDPGRAFTVASTSVSITITSFSESGSNYI